MKTVKDLKEMISDRNSNMSHKDWFAKHGTPHSSARDKALKNKTETPNQKLWKKHPEGPTVKNRITEQNESYHTGHKMLQERKERMNKALKHG